MRLPEPVGRAAVADLRRLGQRGSYRLGTRRLGGDGGARLSGRAGRASPAPHVLKGTAFSPSRGRPRFGWWLATVLSGAVVIAVAAEFGAWFVPFAAGLIIGLATRRASWRLRHTVPAVLVMALAGWGLPLLWQAVRGEPIGATARVVAALAGLPPHAVVGVVFTLLVAGLQALAGLWLGRAVLAGRQAS